jgi:hypothetical protein
MFVILYSLGMISVYFLVCVDGPFLFSLVSCLVCGFIYTSI